MRVKTFTGSSAAQVMAQIKKELGPEAVILSNQTRKEGGRSVVEIMAAVEPGGGDEVPSSGRGSAAGVGGLQGGSPGASLGGVQGGVGPAWEREWDEIKGHLNALLKPHLNLESLPPRQKMALEYLQREGLDEAILTGLFRQLKTTANASILAELGKAARVKPLSQFKEKFQMVAGPSGAGKTTALVRLALAYKKAHPEARICLLGCDGRGVGGKAILKRSAELSGIAYAEAPEPEDMTKALLASRNFDAVFCDLPALEPGTTLSSWLTQRSLEARPDVAVHLALPPYLAPAHYRTLWEKHRSPALKSLIWTKLDEACSFTSLINVGQATGLPASALSSGPGAASPLAEASSQALWKLVFSHQLPTAGHVGAGAGGNAEQSAVKAA